MSARSDQVKEKHRQLHTMWNEESWKKKIKRGERKNKNNIATKTLRLKDDKKVHNFSFNSLVNQNKQNYVIQIAPQML